MTVDFKDELFSDNTEWVLSLFDVQHSDKQAEISEPFSFIAVKNEIQVNIFFILCSLLKGGKQIYNITVLFVCPPSHSSLHFIFWTSDWAFSLQLSWMVLFKAILSHCFLLHCSQYSGSLGALPSFGCTPGKKWTIIVGWHMKEQRVDVSYPGTLFNSEDIVRIHVLFCHYWKLKLACIYFYSITKTVDWEEFPWCLV